ncbi:MAG: DUF2155 domain-containing protein [Alphaproteobacteria bacterium]
MKKIFLLLILLFPLKSFAVPTEFANVIVLDKITAITQKYKMKVGEKYAVDNLDITVEKCEKTPPEDTPESAIFITIVELENDYKELFKGWMFASNPSINSLEHAIYDVWLMSCE